MALMAAPTECVADRSGFPPRGTLLRADTGRQALPGHAFAHHVGEWMGAPTVWAGAISLLAVGLRVYVLAATHTTTEDFLITLRYARNLAAGQGVVYNPGEHVLGATSPLYTLLLAGLYRLGLDAGLAGKVINILADGCASAMLCLLLVRMGYPRAGRVAGILYAATSAPINFACGGMETGLVSLAEVSAITAYVAYRERALWTWLALLVLVRIDGLALAAILAAAWALARRPFHLRNASAALILVGGWFAFATIYFGSPVPTSVTAKLVAYGHVRTAGVLPNLPEFAKQFGKGPFQVALLICFMDGVAVAWRRVPALRMPIVWVLIYYGVMLTSRVPAFGWYFVPPLPVYYAVAALALEVLLRSEDAPGAHSHVWQIAGGSVEALLVVLLLVHIPGVARDVARAQVLEDYIRRPIGEWLARNTAPTDRVLLEPLGYIGFYSGRPMIDVVGIVSPQVLRFYRAGAADPLADMIAALRPEYVLLGNRDAVRLGLRGSQKGDARIRYAYRFVRGWPDESDGPTYFLFRRIIPKRAGLRNPARPFERPIMQRGRPRADALQPVPIRRDGEIACVRAFPLQVPVATGGGSRAGCPKEGLLESEEPLLPRAYSMGHRPQTSLS